MSTTTIDPLLTVEDLGAFVGKTRAAIYKMHQRGQGPDAIIIGRELRFRRAAVEAWLDANAAA